MLSNKAMEIIFWIMTGALIVAMLAYGLHQEAVYFCEINFDDPACIDWNKP